MAVLVKNRRHHQMQVACGSAEQLSPQHTSLLTQHAQLEQLFLSQQQLANPSTALKLNFHVGQHNQKRTFQHPWRLLA